MLHARKDYNERIQDNANEIGTDEPVFLLRAQDEFMLPMLLHYGELVLEEYKKEVHAALLIALYKHIARVIEWQTLWGIKTPDLPPLEIV